MKASLKHRVRQRARGLCEYCRMPSQFYLAPYQMDHILAEQHGGATTLSNLALACFHCNLHKGPNIAGQDPVTRRLTRLFHPRRDRWNDHFGMTKELIVGKTAIGRTTVVVLDMNHEAYVLVRQALLDAGVSFT